MNRRSSGILLHVTSLPGPFGIGDLGPEAFRFVDFLSDARQGYWQILPLNPTSLEYGNSPYSSYSAFAGNPLMISPEKLVQEGFLSPGDLRFLSVSAADQVRYPAVTTDKRKMLDRAFLNFHSRLNSDFEYLKFCEDHRVWLDDFSFFAAYADRFGKGNWSRWPSDIRDRKGSALRRWQNTLREEIDKQKFVQFLFFKQWRDLRRYANDKNIQIIGDLPIYVEYHSADVWAHPEVFQLDARKRPSAVAGIPPDFFSSTGQLWNNPLYRWEELKRRGYDWWVDRVRHNLSLFEIVRLDHFKGFIDYWKVPAGDKTAVNGRWVEGPGEDLFNALLKHFPYLPFIAEDLGVITPDVHWLRDRFGLPGMRILQFAFGNDPLADFYKPSHYIGNCVAYTGTHDNDTLASWLYGKADYSTRRPEEIRKERRRAFEYIGRRPGARKDIHWEFIRLLMMSSANTVIFPLQDILGIGEEGRMNRPATAKGNWEWRLEKHLKHSLAKKLGDMTSLYGRE